jgi:hypothetical protein
MVWPLKPDDVRVSTAVPSMVSVAIPPPESLAPHATRIGLPKVVMDGDVAVAPDAVIVILFPPVPNSGEPSAHVPPAAVQALAGDLNVSGTARPPMMGSR